MTAEEEVAHLMRGAHELYALNDFTGALVLFEKVLALTPRRDAVQLRDDCVATLTRMNESRLGPPHGVPEVLMPLDEIIWLNLDHRAGFVLAQVDGELSYEQLLSVCGLSRYDLTRILAQLLQEGVIRTRPR